MCGGKRRNRLCHVPGRSEGAYKWDTHGIQVDLGPVKIPARRHSQQSVIGAQPS